MILEVYFDADNDIFTGIDSECEDKSLYFLDDENPILIFTHKDMTLDDAMKEHYRMMDSGEYFKILEDEFNI